MCKQWKKQLKEYWKKAKYTILKRCLKSKCTAYCRMLKLLIGKASNRTQSRYSFDSSTRRCDRDITTRAPERDLHERKRERS